MTEPVFPNATENPAVGFPVQRPVRPLRELLTEHEAAFVEWVYRNPGSRFDGGIAQHWVDEGSEHGATLCHWKRPEELGLIECVGSYKWVPTERLVLAA